MSSSVIAILPAAGIGVRMNSTLPKQYFIINGKTLLEHAVCMFLKQSCIKNIVVAVHPDDRLYRNIPIIAHPKVIVVAGGLFRSHSVLSALRSAPKSDWVLTHDVSRPCLHQEDLSNLLKVRFFSDVGGVLAIPVCDTLKKGFKDCRNISHTIERKGIWRALTPQIFLRDLLLDCMERIMVNRIEITDESSALERFGYHPILVPGRRDNIKITYFEDLDLANFLFSKKNKRGDR